MFLAAEGCWMELESIDQPGWTSEVVYNPKISIFIFSWREVADGVSVYRPTWLIIRSWMKSKKENFIFLAGEDWQMGFESINLPDQSSEVESNPKISISFFWLESGGGWDLSPLTSPANHQILNVIQKQAFRYFYLERGGGHYSNPLTIPVDHKKFKRNPKMKHFIFLAGDWWQMGFESINLPSQS